MPVLTFQSFNLPLLPWRLGKQYRPVTSAYVSEVTCRADDTVIEASCRMAVTWR